MIITRPEPATHNRKLPEPLRQRDGLQFTDAFLEPLSTEPQYKLLRTTKRPCVGEGRGYGEGKKDRSDRRPVTTTHQPDTGSHPNETDELAWENLQRDEAGTQCQMGPAPGLGSTNRACLGKASDQQKVGRTSPPTSHPLQLPMRQQVWESATPTPAVEDDILHAVVCPASPVCSARSWFVPVPELWAVPPGLSSWNSFSGYPNPRPTNLVLEQGPHNNEW